MGKKKRKKKKNKDRKKKKKKKSSSRGKNSSEENKGGFFSSKVILAFFLLVVVLVVMGGFFFFTGSSSEVVLNYTGGNTVEVVNPSEAVGLEVRTTTRTIDSASDPEKGDTLNVRVVEKGQDFEVFAAYEDKDRELVKVYTKE